MRRALLSGLFALCVAGTAWTRTAAQEASAGVDLRATLTGQVMASDELTESPRDGSPATAGFRAMVYPTWKINNNLSVSGALQFVTRPYFYSDFSTTGYGAKGYVLQASLNYSR